MEFLRMLGIRGKSRVNTELVFKGSLCHEVKEDTNGNYTVRSVEDMYWLAKMVNDYGYNFVGKTIRLGADIDFKGLPWVPVGTTVRKAFSGIFDGCGYCISGIRVEGEVRYAGLFGVISGVNKLLTAEVYNLRLSSFSVKSTHLSAFVGGVAGYTNEGVRIEKCLVAGVFEGKCYTGGIVGVMEDCASVRRCAIRGKVDGGQEAGAIAGRMQINSTVINCRNDATDLYGRSVSRLVGEWDETSLIG